MNLRCRHGYTIGCCSICDSDDDSELDRLRAENAELRAIADAVEAIERERYAPLMQAVEWLLDDGHMNQEHLARIRAAWGQADGYDAAIDAVRQEEPK
jgi:hypothetical protein